MSTLQVDTLQKRDGTDYTLSERNKIINGDFQIAQRNTSFTSSNSLNDDVKYTLDRWQLFSDGNDVVDVSQESTTVPTNQRYAISLDVETANKKFGIAQKIEQDNCVDLIGSKVTLSFKAKVSSTSYLNNVKCAIISWDGTADTLTDDMISAWGAGGTDPTLAANYTYENTPVNLNLTTSYATYTTTATIDTSGAKNVVVFIWSDVTSTATGDFLYITDVQLEKGPKHTTFERKTRGQQLAECQRYYYHTFDGVAGASENGFQLEWGSFSGNHVVPHAYPVRMHSTPTVIGYNTTGTVNNFSSSAGNVTAIFYSSRANGVSVYANYNGSYLRYNFTADAEL